ncbi:MAG: hypothetical protein JXA54_05810 [Candidatus Heimdallarchaeota archaeon]|nr:hypothetical protein [Candidatus Heimdallarchaeota archaeon]
MKQRLLDILVCPYDKNWPVILHAFEKRNIENPKLPAKDENTKVVCRFYCAKKNIKLVEENPIGNHVLVENIKKIDYEKDCSECLSHEIVAGIIECSECKNYYPIIDEIPMMLKTELRNEDIERAFTDKWADKIKEILQK